jgi:hypothetical protein
MLQIMKHDKPAAMTLDVKNNKTGQESKSLIRLAALAAALAFEAFCGLVARGWSWLVVLSAAAFALTAVFGSVWLS